MFWVKWRYPSGLTSHRALLQAAWRGYLSQTNKVGLEGPHACLAKDHLNGWIPIGTSRDTNLPLTVGAIPHLGLGGVVHVHRQLVASGDDGKEVGLPWPSVKA